MYEWYFLKYILFFDWLEGLLNLLVVVNLEFRFKNKIKKIKNVKK